MALQHGFVFSFLFLNLFWRCVLLLLQVSDCIMPHDGVVVIRWSLVKILQKLASMDFLMARHGIAAWNCVFFVAFEFGLALCFCCYGKFMIAWGWCSRNPLISGEDTPKISQHGFSDGKKWHCNMDLCFLSGFWICVGVVFCCYCWFLIAWCLMMV